MTTPVRDGLWLPPRPACDRILKLPRDHRGFPIPWFIHIGADGVPDFRCIAPGKFATAIRRRFCWVCGEPLGVRMTFVIGPMCAVTRTTSEPPNHFSCAEFAARACPFLTKPAMRYQPNDDLMASGALEAPGLVIDRNPGVACLWTTRSYSVFSAPSPSPQRVFLLKVGDPEHVAWFREGRPASRGEVEASIMSGLPLLEETAKVDGPDALAELETLHQRLWPYLPKEEVA